MIMVGGQILIVFIGGRAFAITRLDGDQWAISIVLGALSIPVGAIIRLIPDELFARRNWGINRVKSSFGFHVGRRAVDE
jgi:Ca2+-transporting ATPase